MFVGISAVGVFRTDDDGATWQTANQGTRAEFLPEKYPEFGQCVHKLLLAPGRSPGALSAKPLRRLSQRGCRRKLAGNHGRACRQISVFRWLSIRAMPKRFTCCRSKARNSGVRPKTSCASSAAATPAKPGKRLSNGLPQENVFAGIYREGMAVDTQDPAGIYFGTNNGKIFASKDEGNSWTLLADNLPPVFSVATAAIE